MNATLSSTTAIDAIAGIDEKMLPGVDSMDELELANNTTIHTITLALTAIGLLIYIPFALYIAYPLFIRRKDIILQKRYVTLSLISVAFLLIEVIALIISQLFIFKAVYKNDMHSSHIAQDILESFHLFSGGSFICIMSVRFWFIYYDTNYNILMANDKWKSVIDDSYNTQNNFFITNKATLGNKAYLMRYVYVDIVFGSIMTPIIVYFGLSWIEPLFMIIFYIAFFVIYMKLKRLKFYDEFHIFAEFRLLGITLSVIILIWVLLAISTLILSLIAQQKLRNSVMVTVYMFVYFQVYILYNIWCVYVMTRWVVKKIESDPAVQQQYTQQRNVPKRVQLQLQTLAVNADSVDLQIGVNKNRELQPIKLEQILINNEHFISFMKHLSSEFSMELLLSLVEFIAFKQIIYKQIIYKQLDENECERDQLSRMNLAECIPESSIVYDKSDDLKGKALKLYKKYIQIGCEYEINISGVLRKQLMDRFEGNVNYDNDSIEWSENVLYKCFDDCCAEMMKLLGYSLTRFKNKAEYLRLQKFKK